MPTHERPPIPHDLGHPRMQHWPSPLKRQQPRLPWAPWPYWPATVPLAPYPLPPSTYSHPTPLPPTMIPPPWQPYAASSWPTPYPNVSIPIPGSAPLPSTALPPISLRYPSPGQHPSCPPWANPATAPPPPPEPLPQEPGPEAVWPSRELPPGSVPSRLHPLPFEGPRSWEPGVFPPIPLGTPAPIKLHPALLYNPCDLSLPPLQWDILHGPNSARLLTPRCLFVAPPLDEPAFDPPITHLYVTGDTQALHWWMDNDRWGPLTLTKTSGSFTVREVLDYIHTYFQAPLSPDEVAAIDATEDTLGGKTRLRFARQQRLEQSYIIEHDPEVFRRVDVVGGHRKFMGMRVQIYADDTWKILLGLMEGPSPRWTLDRRARV
ncbi:hypothetical protein BD626DRAFT_18455 [Schizophyllum amplum]|uniref:DUF6699 domain-containing protein n=1 Tax=Schizophyllum amplum TaxID=97359 RepID=A0A550CYD9_9AGAR|nr:hypothetical protein BD626DRAFT_18455 [Auriculariopsis ampla]